MALISDRHRGYQAGVALLFLGYVVYVVGFASPYWTEATISIDEYPYTIYSHYGLWQTCAEELDVSACRSILDAESSSAEWAKFKATQALQCLALIGLGLAIAYAFHVNFRRNADIFGRTLECVTGVASVMALIGVIIFGTEMKKSANYINHDQTIANIHIKPMSWAFIVDTMGCSLTLIAAILVAVFNKPLPSTSAIGTAVVAGASYKAIQTY